MVPVTNHEVQCECCQAGEIDEVAVLREHNRILGLGLAELARALGAQRRENARLEATKRQLAAELKAAYRRVKPHKEPPVELGVQDRIWADSVRRALEAKRAAAKEVA